MVHQNVLYEKAKQIAGKTILKKDKHCAASWEE